jgi:hypothetical protein
VLHSCAATSDFGTWSRTTHVPVNIFALLNVSCYDNRMIQRLINLLSSCFSCLQHCSTRPHAILSEQAYGEIEIFSEEFIRPME